VDRQGGRHAAFARLSATTEQAAMGTLFEDLDLPLVRLIARLPEEF